MTRRAFTVIELLVVVGIIAVLIAILLPVLGRVRESAKTTQCLSNLRQIGQAILIYSSDNDGYLPPSRDHSYVTHLDTTVKECVQRYLPTGGNSAAAHVVFTCPSSLMIPGQWPLTYGGNVNALPYRDPAWPTEPPLVRLATIHRSAEVIELADCTQASGAGTGAWWISGSDTDLCGYNNPSNANKPIPIENNTDNAGAYGVRYRHANERATNALFFDGHAETMRLGSILCRNFATKY